MMSMWGWPESLDKIRSGGVDPEVAAEVKAKQEAEKRVNEEGVGECITCRQEIIKNERGSWESDFLLEYCNDARDHRHKPKIVWKTNESI